MKLVASLLVKNELGRYLEPCVAHLLEFCDEVAILDDGSTDGWPSALMGAWGSDGDRVIANVGDGESRFFNHEGRTRQALLDFTLTREPTHVLSIDADEFVADGAAVRTACAEDRFAAWTLSMEEVWKAFDECLCVRQDGGWRPHPVPILWRVPENPGRDFSIRDAALACGREPSSVRRLAQTRQAAGPVTEILHFGWANVAEREARHQRYAVADGGRFHASAHLASILLPDDRVEMESRDWPAGLDGFRDEIIRRTGHVGSGA